LVVRHPLRRDPARRRGCRWRPHWQFRRHPAWAPPRSPLTRPPMPASSR